MARVQDFQLGELSAAKAKRQTLRERARAGERRHAERAYPGSAGQSGALTALLMTGLLTVLP